MLTESQEKKLQFLRNMPEIFIPSNFTYWCHNTMYKPQSDWKVLGDKKNWIEIPIDEIVLKSDMSFVTKVQRIQTAVDYGNAPSMRYANTANSLPFQIRVVQPKRNKLKLLKEEGIISEEEFRKKLRCADGLGDFRHPKLPAKTKIYIFGSAIKDEISGAKIDIVYGVAEEDIGLFVSEIMKEYTPQCQEDANYSVVDRRAMEADKPTVILKNEDKSRLRDAENGVKAGYKTEYKNFIRQK